MIRARALAPVCVVSLAALVAACSQQGSSNTQSAQAPPAPAQPVQAQTPGQTGPLSLQAINSAQFSPMISAQAGRSRAARAGTAASSKTPDPVLIRAEVLLDRARFSPGVMDGLTGQNLQNALKAYEAAHNLPGNGQLTPQAWQALTADSQPVLTTYTITPQDVAGPWSPDVGEDMVKLSELKATGYHSPLELLA